MKFFDDKTITVSFLERLGLFIGTVFLSLFMFAIGLGAFTMTQNNNHEIIGGFLIITSICLLYINTIALLGYGMARNNKS